MFRTIDNIFTEIGSGLGILPDASRYSSVSAFFVTAVNLVIGIGFSLSLMGITLSAIMYILSGGNPEKTSKAWRAFLYGVIGGAITLGIVVLKEIVFRWVGLDTSGISEIESGY